MSSRTAQTGILLIALLGGALPPLPEAAIAAAPGDLQFNDRGDTYNPLDYVRTIRTGDGAYTIEFRNDEESYFTNFIVSSEGVIAFDPLSDSAARAYADIITAVAPGRPLAAIIYSHLHTDHIAGARVLRQRFGEQVPIIGHARVTDHFERWPLPFIEAPTQTVSDLGAAFAYGDRTVELHYLGDAHTASILVAVIPELRMAYVCDFANNDVVGWTDLPGIDIDEMLRMQRRAAELDVDTVTFCHGPPGTTAAIERQIAYFETLLETAMAALDAGLSEDQAAATVELPAYRGFANYDDWFSDNVRAAYRWVKSRRSR